MPKFTYSASKGIEQSSGSGFYVNDVPLLEEVNAVGEVSADPTASLNAYGVNTWYGDGSAFDVTIPVGTTAGQKVVMIAGVHGGGGNYVDGVSLTSAIVPSSVAVFVWNGTTWIKVSA